MNFHHETNGFHVRIGSNPLILQLSINFGVELISDAPRIHQSRRKGLLGRTHQCALPGSD